MSSNTSTLGPEIIENPEVEPEILISVQTVPLDSDHEDTYEADEGAEISYNESVAYQKSCFICNVAINELGFNLYETTSEHTKSRLSDFEKKPSIRNAANDSSALKNYSACVECTKLINKYDEVSLAAKRYKTVLRRMLNKTEDEIRKEMVGAESEQLDMNHQNTSDHLDSSNTTGRRCFND